MPTRNVNLTEHFDRFIEVGITSGRFSNASEVVRESLRLLEQREQEFSRSRVSGSKVKEPRHFLLYRRRDDGVIEVAPILHDGRDLQRHLPEDYRRGGIGGSGCSGLHFVTRGPISFTLEREQEY